MGASSGSRATLADVAARAGVAKSTASLAFNDPGRVSPDRLASVLNAARELGFQGPSAVGRALASGRTNVAAIVTRVMTERPETDPFTLQTVDGLSRGFAAAGFGVLLLPPVTDDHTRRLFASAPMDGVVTVRRLQGFDEIEALLADRGIPHLSLDGLNTEAKAVLVDDMDAVERMLAHLTDLGHTRIATVTMHHSLGDRTSGIIEQPDPAQIEIAPTRARLRAFDNAGVRPWAVYRCGHVTRAHGRTAGDALLGLAEPPTAIVCQTDLHAAGVIDAVRARGLRVPEDVSVTGFDGLDLPGLDGLELTTVVQDGVQKGRLCAQYLVGLINGEHPEPETLTVPLRIGSSTAPPRP